jgi:hypothetical protein
LRLGRVHEHVRGDEYRGDPAGLEVGDVVHTARRTRASISQGFDDHVAALGDLPP